MFRRLLSVGGFTLLSRITGFIRDILMAAALGNGLLSDAFLVAFLFPNYFRAIFGESTINPAFLPRYAALKARGEDEAAAIFADRVFSWQMAAQFVLLLAALAFMPFIMHVVAPGFAEHPGQTALAATLSRITFPYLILTVVAVQLSAMLNANERFWAAAAWSNFLNLAMIGTLLAARWFPNAAYAAAWGVLIGGVAQLAFILWAGAREGLFLRLRRPRWTPEIKEFFKAFGAVTIGAASFTIAPLVDTLIASLLPIGSRTALYYADRINQLPLGVLGIALGTVLLPDMSTRLAKGDAAGANAAQNRAAAMGLFLTLPFAVAFFVVPDAIMRGVFAHGAFDRGAAALSASALAAYGVGLPAMVLVRIVAATFYARHDTVTPVRATLTAMAVNIALKFVFVWGMGFGVWGVALGTALGAWVNVGILVWFGRRRALLTIDSTFRRAVLPILLAAGATGAGAYAGVRLAPMYTGGLPVMLQRTLHLSPASAADALALGASILLASAAYGAVALLCGRWLPFRKSASP
jgi:putative peptidoglycan lipid II flippase